MVVCTVNEASQGVVVAKRLSYVGSRSGLGLRFPGLFPERAALVAVQTIPLPRVQSRPPHAFIELQPRARPDEEVAAHLAKNSLEERR